MNKIAVFSASLILLECLLWGIGNVIVNITLQTMPTILCLGLRSAIAAFLFLCFFRKRIKAVLKKEHILPCSLIGTVSTASFLTAMLSLKYCEATTASFLISLSVIFAPFFSFFILGKRIDARIVVPIVIIVIGLYYLCGGNVEFKFGFGEIIGVVCSACYALVLVLSQKHLKGIDPAVISVFQTGVGAVSCLTLSLIFEDASAVFRLTVSNWYAVIFLGVFATFAAFLFQNYALKNLSSTFVSILFCTESVFSAIFAFLIINERLSAPEIFGSVLVLAGIVAASLTGEQKTRHNVQKT